MLAIRCDRGHYRYVDGEVGECGDQILSVIRARAARKADNHVRLIVAGEFAVGLQELSAGEIAVVVDVHPQFQNVTRLKQTALGCPAHGDSDLALV